MQVDIHANALDRVPLSIIFDDSTMLVNLNYFFMRDRNLIDGEPRRWEDVPVVHPESFTREFAEFCLAHGVKGKFSVVPCPAALGRIDHGLPMFSKAQQESWLKMCRELIMPNYDITPEMMTHTFVVDLKTLQPVDPNLWEQYGWNQLPTDQEELVTDYIALACEILNNVGLTPAGVTSPGGFGSPLDFYARCAENAVRRVTGNPTPYLFKRVSSSGSVDRPVWYPKPERGEAMGEIIASTGDKTGSWTGYGEVDPNYYITADLQGGRLPEVIDAGDPGVLISHWQGFYGIHNDDRRGFRAFQTVVRRLEERDPKGERTRWRKCSEITNYAIAREMAQVVVDGQTILMTLPVLVPELTVCVRDVLVNKVTVDGKPLTHALTRSGFEDGTFYRENDVTYLAFTPTGKDVKVEVG
ncbi:MAG: hypothetical protein ACO36I_05845 [Candidatus Latescibacterota bacterium]